MALDSHLPTGACPVPPGAEIHHLQIEALKQILRFGEVNANWGVRGDDRERPGAQTRR